VKFLEISADEWSGIPELFAGGLAAVVSARWFIHKNGQALGPYSSADVRAGLRDGTFDPFDLVSRDGSNLRRELVEVDEVFAEGADGLDAGSGPPASAGALALEGGARGGRNNGPVAGQGALLLASPGDNGTKPGVGALVVQGGRGSGGASSAELAAAAAARKRRRNPRHFHLQDPQGRVMGPLSATEIRALFYKGVLDKSVRVMRDGSPAKVPVAKFVAIYSDVKKNPNAMSQAAHPHYGAGGMGGLGGAGGMGGGGPSQSAMRRGMQVAASRGGVTFTASPLVIAILAAALVFGTLAAWLAFSRGGLSARWGNDRGGGEVDKRKKPKKRPTRREPQGPGPLGGALPRPGKKPPATVAPVKKKQQTQRVKPRKTALQRRQEAQVAAAKRRAELRRQRQAQQAQQAKAGGKLGGKKYTNPYAHNAYKKVTYNAVQPKPAPVATQPKPVAPPKKAGVAALVDGQTVSRLGPMSYSKAAVAQCSGSCNVTFTGAGGSVQVAFFKAAWGPTLQGKSGAVYVSGRVKKGGGGTKILLSNVE
jgi:hypothetical protein